MQDPAAAAPTKPSPAKVGASLRTCRSCLKQFDELRNGESSCRFHPESFSGETAQRWLPPGETKGGGVVHHFYSCCGAKERDAPGCCSTRHKTFDETENEWGRKPGMGEVNLTKLSLSVLTLLFALLAVPASATAAGQASVRLFVYDWPDLVDRYANFTDRKDAHGVEIPQWRLHHGLGRVISGDNMEHKTSQFALHKIFYERALLDPHRTLDASLATSFFIPFDIGMHTAFLESNGRMRRSNCPSAPSVIQRLNESAHFRRSMGHDHIVVFSLNQNMNYFMAGQRCQDFLRFCWNCTKLSIDEYLFTAQDRVFEMKNRGINWHAVPFPSDYHYSTRALADDAAPLPHPAAAALAPTVFKTADPSSSSPSSSSSSALLPPWERPDPRPTIVSFTGSPRRYNDIATAMREALIKQCASHGTSCVYGKYSHDPKALSNPGKLLRESVFCLQPPGDMPTRKSVFDSILSGCIPVLFHPLTARLMYEWHWGQQLWEEIAVNFDSNADSHLLVDNKADMVARLIDLFRNDPQAVAKRQARLREMAHQLQYSLVSNEPVTTADGGGGGARPRRRVHVQLRDGKPLPDAYSLAMQRVMDIHTGRASHRRSSHFVVCDQLQGRGQLLQTADWCNSTQSLVDPSSPPSVVDYITTTSLPLAL